MAAFNPELAGTAPYNLKSSVTIRSEQWHILEKLAHHFQRGMLVSLGLDQHIEDLTSSGS
jgi:hypothetical protein